MTGRELRSRSRPNAIPVPITATTAGPSIKRQRNTHSPISIPSIPSSPDRTSNSNFDSGSSKSTKSQRDKLFDALDLESATAYPLAEKTIQSADDLGEAQLKKCFEILHACGSATDPEARLSTTRQSIEGFLDTIFHGWPSENPGSLMRSELEFRVDADVVAGRICGAPSHTSILDCASSESCTADVTAVAKYSNNPPMFMLEFTVIDPFNNQPESFCPIARGDVRWVTADWIQDLRRVLQAKIVAKIHNFNKRLAVWHARRLILEWAKGSLSMGDDVNSMGFLGKGTANIAIIGLGRDD